MRDGDFFQINSNYRFEKDWGVFLDRDGVVIKEVHLLHDLKDYKIFPKAIKAIKLLNDKQTPVILATNQTVVARGLAKKNFIDKIHNLIKKDLKNKGAHLDGISYCLHSNRPYVKIKKYKIDCSWRKPNLGMFIFTAKKMGLDLKKSWGIGDTARDILAYQKTGMKDILVKTGHGGKDFFYKAKPTIVKKDILKAVEYILAT